MFEKAELESYKLYYWRIEVSDGKKLIIGENSSERTMCNRTLCEDWSKEDCNECKGKGFKGSHEYTFTYYKNVPNKSCNFCGETLPDVMVVQMKTCRWCGGSMTSYWNTQRYVCRKHRRQDIMSVIPANGECSKHKCETCNGLGEKIKKCKSHDLVEIHYYCDHIEVSDEATHD